jgi:hypothetical protein
MLLHIALLAYDVVYDQYGTTPTMRSTTTGAKAMALYASKIIDELLERGEKKLPPSEMEPLKSSLADICSEM